jgi:hypothetical protein
MTTAPQQSDKEHEPTEPQLPRGLPVVVIQGKHYFADERLREYRAIDNPHDRISMEEAMVLLCNQADSRKAE